MKERLFVLASLACTLPALWAIGNMRLFEGHASARDWVLRIGVAALYFGGLALALEASRLYRKRQKAQSRRTLR